MELENFYGDPSHREPDIVCGESGRGHETKNSTWAQRVRFPPESRRQSGHADM